ncbi:MAG TPA: TetR family transcriptional regulator [Candidatus Binatia bacterium]|jgi:AcrR family transcriptional regulator
MPRRSLADSLQTREAILARAVDLASVEGLAGLTIGRLSRALPMSKSGLFAHFGSREELELAVVEAAAAMFEREVLAGVDSAPPALARLANIALAWLGYIEKGLLRGGCFFAAVVPEIDDRPGRVRDRVATLVTSWTDLLAVEAGRAIEEGHLSGEPEAGEVAFELHAFLQEANRRFQLAGDAAVFAFAARAIERLLAQSATESGRSILAACFGSR